MAPFVASDRLGVAVLPVMLLATGAPCQVGNGRQRLRAPRRAERYVPLPTSPSDWRCESDENLSLCMHLEPPWVARTAVDTLRGIDLGDLDPKAVDLIVVDNDPTGQAQAVCQAASSSLPIALHFTEVHERGISFARNRAVSTALSRGTDLIAFIDDDDLPESDWLIRLVEKQRETQADIVAGILRPLIRTKTPVRLRDTQPFDQTRNARLNTYGIPSGMGTGKVLTGRRIVELLMPLGPLFSTELSFTGGEDRDFFIRANKEGAVFSVAEGSVVHRDFEDSRLTLLEMAKRAFRFGCTSIEMARRHNTRALVRRRSRKALYKLLTGLPMLPLSPISKSLLMRNRYRLSRELGVLYSYSGGKFDHYR